MTCLLGDQCGEQFPSNHRLLARYLLPHIRDFTASRRTKRSVALLISLWKLFPWTELPGHVQTRENKSRNACQGLTARRLCFTSRAQLMTHKLILPRTGQRREIFFASSVKYVHLRLTESPNGLTFCGSVATTRPHWPKD